MNRSITFGLVALCGCLALASAAVDFQHEFDRINDEILAAAPEVAAVDPEACMQKAVARLQSSGTMSQIMNKLRRDPEAPLTEALKLLTALNFGLDGSAAECSWKEYYLLRKNAEATRQLHLSPRSSRPIDQLVYAKSLEHARVCCSLYPTIYKERSQMDLRSGLTERLDTLHKFYLRQVEFKRQFAKGGQWADVSNRTDMYEHLASQNKDYIYEDLADENRELKLEPVDVAKALVAVKNAYPLDATLGNVMAQDPKKSEFYVYLLKPCDHFVSRMDMLTMFQYEKQVLSGTEFAPKPEVVDADSRDFYLGLSKLRLCKKIMDNNEELRQFWIQNWNSDEVTGRNQQVEEVSDAPSGELEAPLQVEQPEERIE